jgi:hypothetical protein
MRGLLERARRTVRSVPTERAEWRPARDVFMAESGGLAVLLDLRQEVYFGLDEVGTAIWQEVEKGAALAAITDRLAGEFDAPVAVLRADAERFIAELEARRLVVRS